MASSLDIQRDNGTVIATLNRPDRLNALDKALLLELDGLIEVLETDKTARALILTGAGEKAFCVGADLKERQKMNEKDILVRLEKVHQVYERLVSLPIPVIAAINGTALGGGLELALACDLRVAASNAVLGLPEVGLAIIPGNGGTQRLSRIVGLSKALELVLLAQRLSAEEAQALGIVNRSVETGKALEQAKDWAKKINASGPIAIAQAKKAIRQGYEVKMKEAIEIEIEAYKPCLYSQDRLEGLRAFSEKRKPNYLGA